MGASGELCIGVDVGGTKVLAAEVDEHGGVRRVARRSTPGRRVEAELVELALGEALDEVADGRRVDAVGIAAAGLVDAACRRVMFAPHLPWQGEDVAARLSARWGVPVALDNDANCTARAEVTHGAAAGVGDAVVVTMGTGIGGAVVVDGVVRRGRNGMAGEFGHMQVVPDGLLCECGGRGCWEQYSSGNALVRLARAGITDSRALDELCEGHPELLDGPMVTTAAQAGDRVALEAYAAVGDWLGVGLANLVAALDPALLVVGGGVSAADETLLAPARSALTRSLVGAAHRVVPPLVRARFGPEAGVVGAADLARSLLGAAGRGRPV